MQDLRCPSRLHGKAVADTIEVKCDSRRCGAGRGAVVLHYFDAATGELLDTKRFKEPQALFSGKEMRNATHHDPAAVRPA